MIKPITNHIHPVTVEELETIHAHVNGTFAPSSIAKEREAYASGQEASANLFELVAAAMPERNTKVLCNIDLSAPIEQLQAEIAALRVWAYGDEQAIPTTPNEPGPAANFFVKFIAGNPEIFSEIRTSPYVHTTLEEAMSDLSTVDSHGWRGWIEDRDGNRVKENAIETRWATSAS